MEIHTHLSSIMQKDGSPIPGTKKEIEIRKRNASVVFKTRGSRADAAKWLKFHGIYFDRIEEVNWGAKHVQEQNQGEILFAKEDKQDKQDKQDSQERSSESSHYRKRNCSKRHGERIRKPIHKK